MQKAAEPGTQAAAAPQDFAKSGISMDVGPKTSAPYSAVLESVRCLECRAVYSKPGRGGTVQANPGCPECGYVGWVRLTGPVTPEPPSPHSSEDPPQSHSA